MAEKNIRSNPLNSKQKGHLHIVKIIIDPPFIRVSAIPRRHVDREGVAQAVSPTVWARVRTAFTRIGAERNVSALVFLERGVGRLAFLTMLYGRLGVTRLLTKLLECSKVDGCFNHHYIVFRGARPEEYRHRIHGRSITSLLKGFKLGFVEGVWPAACGPLRELWCILPDVQGGISGRSNAGGIWARDGRDSQSQNPEDEASNKRHELIHGS